jgi:phage terminase small subunit
MAALKPQHRLFADEFMKNPNGTAAAIAAGYSERSAGPQAHELLQRSDVKAYLAERSAKALVKVDASVDRIVQELAALGFSDIRQIMTADGKGFLPVHEWPREIAVCIASIEVETKDVEADAHEGEERAAVTLTTRVTKVKLWPKVQALALLAQYRKMVGAGDSIPSDLRQQFVGLAVTVAPGATANIQVIAPPGAKGDS